MSSAGNKAIATSESPIQSTGWHEPKKLYLKSHEDHFFPADIAVDIMIRQQNNNQNLVNFHRHF
tara:strand:- start:177 stop:368 length:192 start_codon:yes stop_codon:yes gene_type:complete